MVSRSSPRHIHWRSPTIISVAFFAALAFAVGHHEFYANLDNKVVDTDDRLFSQQVNIAIGNAFALLFRAALVIALATVYWQIFWTALLRQRKAVAISHIDALAGALTSLFDLLHLRALLRQKTLLALAVLTWLLPLAAVLPPATLSVTITKHTKDAELEVPTLDFANPSLVYKRPSLKLEADAETGMGGYNTTIEITGGASSDLHDLLEMVAAGHVIPDFPSIGTNKSHQLEFPGSTLQCTNISDENLVFFRDKFLCRGSPSSCNNLGAGQTEEIFSGWVPYHTSRIWKPEGPEELRELEEKLTPAQNATRDFSTRWSEGNRVPQEPAENFGSPYLLIATRSFRPSLFDNGTRLSNWEVLNCSLHYATYAVTMLSTNERSFVSEYNVDPHDDIILPATSNLQESITFSPPESSDFGHLALLSCLDLILTGKVDTIDRNGGAADSGKLPVSGSSGILGTTLMYARELLLANVVQLGHLRYPYNVTEHYWNKSSFDDVISTASTFNRSLAFSVEELYHNMTLCLFSRKRFLADHSETTKITTELWHNTYTYRSRNLLLSYGIALLLSLAACTLGCFAIYHNGVSYSNRFSTILRVARGHELAEIDSLLTQGDREGTDPLSRHLATTRLALGRDVAEDSVEHCETGAELQQMVKRASEQDVIMEQSEGEGGSKTRAADGLLTPVRDVSSELNRESLESLQHPPRTSGGVVTEDHNRERAGESTPSDGSPVVTTM